MSCGGTGWATRAAREGENHGVCRASCDWHVNCSCADMSFQRQVAPLAFCFLAACGSSSRGSSSDGSSGADSGNQGATSAGGGPASSTGSGATGSASDTTGSQSGTGTTTSSGSSGGSAGTGTGGATGSSGGAGGSAGQSSESTSGDTTGSGGTAGSGEACEGFPDATHSSCTSESDCPGGNSCHFPGDGPVCGAACFQDRQCESDAEGPEGVCEQYDAGCCPEGTLSSECRARCTESSCPDGTQCNDAGHCECTNDGCGVNQACEDVDGDTRRCVRRSCTDATDCDCGVCSDGRCTPPPDVGYCQPPVP